MKSSVYKCFLYHDLSILIRLHVEMLLPFLFSQLLVLTIANPFHKYPYVFLLDVGNEEIEKAEVEQIRLTIPGGSMAVKYPATGDGDLIAHVRVSGIDFGTDLKASIVEGGPGYKYVVIVFAGNPGNSYDAVVTIQTMPVNSEENGNSPTNSDNSDEDDDEKDVDDNENSIENTNDSGSMTVYDSEDSVVMQSSSNIYKYAVNDAVSQKYGDDESSDSDDGNADDQSNDNSDSNDQSDNYAKDDFSENDVSVSEKISGKYTAFKPHFYGGVRFYPQAAVYTQSVYDQSDDKDASVDEDANQRDKYRDSNNHRDVDYAPPVEY